MALTLSEHLKKSFEMGKDIVPVYWRLLLKVLIYVIGLFAVIWIGLFFDFPSAVRFLFLIVYVCLLFMTVVVGVRYEVAKLKAVEAVGKGKADIEKIWMESKGNFWKMFFLGLVLMVIIAVGMMLLIIPGFIFLVWYGFAQFAAFIRNQDIFGALSYSKRVAKGHFWMIIGRMFVIVLLGFIIMWPTRIFQNRLSARVDMMVPNEEHKIENYDVRNMQSLFENIKMRRELRTTAMLQVLDEMKFTVAVYVFYSAVVAFFFMCFVYPYWYLLFIDLEKINNVK